MAALHIFPLFLVPFAHAMPWLGPMQTPEGLVDSIGISPKPTDAPGFEKIPHELRPRATSYQWPPPPNWCGFISSQYSNPLSCSSGYTCVSSGGAVGCCSATTGACAALYTDCSNYFDHCNTDCSSDPAVRKCTDTARPWCGTYEYDNGDRLYNCQATSASVVGVESLNDFYSTALGSSVSSAGYGFSAFVTQGGSQSQDPNYFNNALPSISPASQQGAAASTSPAGKVSSDSSDDLSDAAYAGIGIGIVAAIALVVGAIFFFIVWGRKRRRRQQTMVKHSNGPAPQNPLAAGPGAEDYAVSPGKTMTAGGYQSVPREEDLFQENKPPMAQAPPSPYLSPGGMAGGAAVGAAAGANTAYASPSPNQYPSPSSPSQYTQQPGSEISSSTPFLSAPGTTDGSVSGYTQQNYVPAPAPFTQEVEANRGDPSAIKSELGGPYDSYKAPQSPNHHEVDGTLGNPGVTGTNPHDAREIDATSGNPGVPRDNSGIPQVQGMPGGTPSSTEIEGRTVNAAASGGGGGAAAAGPPPPGMGSSLNAPFNTYGLYEMGDENRR